MEIYVICLKHFSTHLPGAEGNFVAVFTDKTKAYDELDKINHAASSLDKNMSYYMVETSTLG
jgi:hypothetical protein